LVRNLKGRDPSNNDELSLEFFKKQLKISASGYCLFTSLYKWRQAGSPIRGTLALHGTMLSHRNENKIRDVKIMFYLYSPIEHVIILKLECIVMSCREELDIRNSASLTNSMEYSPP
jgi:hypothetical protein